MIEMILSTDVCAPPCQSPGCTVQYCFKSFLIEKITYFCKKQKVIFVIEFLDRKIYNVFMWKCIFWKVGEFTWILLHTYCNTIYNSTVYDGKGERESGNRKRRRETKLYKKIINNCITYIFPLVPLQNLAQSDWKDDIIVRSSSLIPALGSIFTILVVYLWSIAIFT